MLPEDPEMRKPLFSFRMWAGLVGAADVDATDEVCAEAASGFCFRTTICGGIFAGSEWSRRQ